ncbi:MAG: nucleotidyltransferase family protein [Gammaproteobacteria bacterium]|nr:nucleotidyltransferase family protein [Gammaproteobacteria bacterium]
MTVMILAAGRGKRMGELTENTAKPLLMVAGRSLIAHHLARLADAGFKNVVINIAYLAEQIIDALGDGSAYGLNIVYSDESSSGALETAGGIVHALELLESDPFIVINADIWTDYDFTALFRQPLSGLGHLVMVPNPAHNPDGDFTIGEGGSLFLHADEHQQSNRLRTATFSGIAIYRKAFFNTLQQGKAALAPLLAQAIQADQLSAELYEGQWSDIGTPERLIELSSNLERRADRAQ